MKRIEISANVNAMPSAYSGMGFVRYDERKTSAFLMRGDNTGMSEETAVI